MGHIACHIGVPIWDTNNVKSEFRYGTQFMSHRSSDMGNVARHIGVLKVINTYEETFSITVS